MGDAQRFSVGSNIHTNIQTHKVMMVIDVCIYCMFVFNWFRVLVEMFRVSGFVWMRAKVGQRKRTEKMVADAGENVD